MAHFAQLDQNNVVVQVLVVKNNEILDENGNESEAKGIAFCQSLYGADTRWAQTSYNANFRGRYAAIGYTYDASYDAFIKPKPIEYPSWIIDPVTTEWVPPVPRPTDDVYKWNEVLLAWLRVPSPYPSWVMQGDPLGWYPPVPYPSDGKFYEWDEATLSWVSVSNV
jgi:hypothetical protein